MSKSKIAAGYGKSYQSEPKITYLNDFANYLRRESVDRGCRGIGSGWKSADRAEMIDKIRRDCRDAEKHWAHYAREKGEWHPEKKSPTCSREALKRTKAFVKHFGQEGKDRFCNAANDYFERENWNWKNCEKALTSARPTSSRSRYSEPEIESVFAKPEGAGYNDLCPYVDEAFKRMRKHNERLAESSPQSLTAFLRQMGEPTKRRSSIESETEDEPETKEREVKTKIKSLPAKGKKSFIAAELLASNPYARLSKNAAFSRYWNVIGEDPNSEEETNERRLLFAAHPRLAKEMQ